MSISLLRRLLMKEAVKDTASSSGIMSINKNITEKVEKQLQKYVSDAMHKRTRHRLRMLIRQTL